MEEGENPVRDFENLVKWNLQNQVLMSVSLCSEGLNLWDFVGGFGFVKVNGKLCLVSTKTLLEKYALRTKLLF